LQHLREQDRSSTLFSDRLTSDRQSRQPSRPLFPSSKNLLTRGWSACHCGTSSAPPLADWLSVVIPLVPAAGTRSDASHAAGHSSHARTQNVCGASCAAGKPLLRGFLLRPGARKPCFDVPSLAQCLFLVVVSFSCLLFYFLFSFAALFSPCGARREGKRG
jgi:hypothetical protein